MNLRVELVHLNSSGFQIYKFNINLFYKSNSEVEPQILSILVQYPILVHPLILSILVQIPTGIFDMPLQYDGLSSETLAIILVHPVGERSRTPNPLNPGSTPTKFDSLHLENLIKFIN